MCVAPPSRAHPTVVMLIRGDDASSTDRVPAYTSHVCTDSKTGYSCMHELNDINAITLPGGESVLAYGKLGQTSVADA
jgi:hypothetical protein